MVSPSPATLRPIHPVGMASPGTSARRRSVTALISHLMYDCKCVRLCNMQTGGLTGNIMTRLVLTSSLDPSNIRVNLLQAASTVNVALIVAVKFTLKEFRLLMSRFYITQFTKKILLV